MRKAAVLLLSVVVVFIFIGGVITQSLVILQRVAAVSDVTGTVWVKQRGHQEFAALSDRARVNAGDTIKTNSNGSLNLSYLDGTRMRIGPSTVMTVLKCQINTASKAETTAFKLDLGRVWIRVLKVLSQKSKFEVVTPTATAGVRGTIFSVAVGPDGKTVVTVKEGAVATRTGQGETIVDKGQMLAAGVGDRPTQLDAEQAALWQENGGISGPNLEVSAPVAGSSVRAGEAIEVQGQAEPGARVTVNGEPVEVRVKGLFSGLVTAPAPSAPTTFAVKVAATDARGYVTERNVPVKIVGGK